MKGLEMENWKMIIMIRHSIEDYQKIINKIRIL